jgi:predicted ATPase
VLLGLIFRRYADSRIAAEAVVRLAAEHDLQFFKVYGKIHSNWLQGNAGNTADGIMGIRDGIVARKNRGLRVLLPHFLSMLASAYHKAGEVEEGLHVIGEALSMIKATSERYEEAEVFRFNGELLLARDPPNIDEAEVSFLKAIEVARHQSAKTWELRAATSLARLWRSQGRNAEARDVLASVYGWFTGDLDLADLKDARALLDELNAGIGKARVSG